MDWDDLRYFLAVSRTKSLTEASIRLKVSQATVARRIAALEASLKTNLFSKRIDGYRLTEAGTALVEPAELAEAQMLWVERAAVTPAQALSGVIRVEMPELLGQHIIIPRLKPFFDANPSVSLELIADVRSARLTKGEADVLIRLSRPAHGDYSIRRIGRLTMGLYSSEDYLRSFKEKESTGDHDHRLIGWEPSLSYLPMARWLEEQMVPGGYVVRSHTLGSQLAAVQAGLGVAVLPALVARRNGLVRIVDEHALLDTDIWILQLHDSQKLARVRALVDFLADMFSKLEDELSRA